MDAVLGRCDRDSSPGDDERIIDIDAVLKSRCNRQTAAAVDGQIIMGKDRAAGIVRQRLLGVDSPAAERVLRVLRQGQEDLVRLIDPQASSEQLTVTPFSRIQTLEESWASTMIFPSSRVPVSTYHPPFEITRSPSRK